MILKDCAIKCWERIVIFSLSCIKGRKGGVDKIMEKGDFTVSKTDDMLVLFVNSNIKPFKETPLNVYKAQEDSGYKHSIYRLYNVEYLESGSIIHKVLIWREVKIKLGSLAAVTLIINAQNAITELLEVQ
jgi:hypothetical protein